MTETTLTVRRYQADDKAAVRDIHERIHAELGSDTITDTDLDLIETLFLEKGEFLVGLWEGRLVALGGLRPRRGRVGDISRFGIHPEARGHGFDQVMLDALTQRARELGMGWLVQEVHERRGGLRKLVEANGFTCQGSLLVNGRPCAVYDRALEAPAADLSGQMAALIAAAELSGIAVASATVGSAPEVTVLGTAVDGTPLDESSLYPTASLTKLAAALGMLRLVHQGTVSLDDTLSRWVPDAPIADPRITVRRLLSHTAGLAELPDRVDGDWAQVAQSCLETPLRFTPGERVAYSNTGYGLVGVIMERATGLPFGRAMRDLVLEPFGIEAHAADEAVRTTVQGWRFRVLPAGGMFMTIRGASRLIQVFLDPPADLLPRALMSQAVQDQTGGLSGGVAPRLQWAHCPWGLGPEIHGDRYSPWIASTASASSFGHAGASGCVAWADPELNAAWAILTVPPTDSARGVRWHLQTRPNLADLSETIRQGLAQGR